MMKMKIFLTLSILVAPIVLLAQTPVDTANIVDIDTTGQRDLIDIGRAFFKIKTTRPNTKSRREIFFSVLPLSSNVPGGSKALVTSTTAGFYLGRRKTTYLSGVTFAPYFNFAGRYGLPIHSSIWLANNIYNIQGDTRFLVYPQYTWGLGGGQLEANKLLVSYNYIRFYQSALKRIKPYFYVGAGYNLDYYININTGSQAPLPEFTGYPYGTATGKNSFSNGINLDLLYDTRQNSFNPIPGSFINVIYRHNAEFLGSDENAASLFVDVRKYLSLSNTGEKNILAFRSFLWTTLSAGTPYLNLPAIGMDPDQRSGRGIEQARYRGESLLYFECEYRRDITRNGLLGFVVFANLNSASQPNGRSLQFWNPAAGTGLRLKFNKKSDTNICVDYGFSKGFSDISISLGEAF